ncbi:MAG: GntR family transcriptional regulator [Acidobacteriaceae bacterium]
MKEKRSILKKTSNGSSVSPLNKQGFIPLYYQIEQALLQKIHSGELSVGDPLDSEEELSRRYQVSRMTARQALHGLKVSGHAFSQKGRGTFVSRPKFEKNEMHLQGFTEEMRHRGMVPSSRVLEQKRAPASEDLIAKLHLQPGDEVLWLYRLRFADGIPMAVEGSNVPLRRFPGLEKFDFSKASLYQVLREHFGVQPGWADETIEALSATSKEADLLTIPKHSSILSITRLVMTIDEVPVEAACSRFRGDRYRALIRVPARSKA